MNNIRLAKFFMFGLRKFSPYIDEVLILMPFPHFRPPAIQEVQMSDRRFLAVW